MSETGPVSGETAKQLTPPQRRNELIYFAGAFAWMLFWTWYQFHFEARTVGPFHIFGLTMFPLWLGPALKAAVHGPDKSRRLAWAVVVIGLLLTLGMLPLVRLLGYTGPVH